MIVTNPATGEAIAEMPDTDPAMVPELAERAAAAQRDWAAVGIDERIAILTRFRSVLGRDTESLASLLTSETGKPITQARAELVATLARIDFFIDHAADALAPQIVDDDVDSRTGERITREPLGVVGNISAWNYPWFVGTNVFVPALVAGNAVLYKPSELATLTGLEVARCWTEAGVPDGVFQTLVGAGALGRSLVDAGPHGMFFTGSYATGLAIATAYAPHMGHLQLELGGKDPAYVAPDADVATAA
ncbi:MAG: aldehyde dehydrogenase family protein, partial [Microthrixaceae bacterium]